MRWGAWEVHFIGGRIAVVYEAIGVGLPCRGCV
jgi:hypothetical protein